MTLILSALHLTHTTLDLLEVLMGIGFAPESLEIVRCPGALLDSGKHGKGQIGLVTHRHMEGRKVTGGQGFWPLFIRKKQLSDSKP